MIPLYAAPMNLYSTPVFRNLLLRHDADFVFSELVMLEEENETYNAKKIEILEPWEIQRTIIQIGAKNEDEIKKGVNFITKIHPTIKEINLNAGCPHSGMIQRKICGGLLQDLVQCKKVAEQLVKECNKKNILPSIKVRLGSKPDNIEIKKILQIMHEINIQKVYIHTRTLGYNYSKPALYLNELKELKKEFPNCTIILNGDIDGYDKAKKISSEFQCDGLMIGRASLSNPLIFKQIKEKSSIQKEPNYEYNPYEKDKTIIKKDGKTFCSTEKLNIIQEIISLGKQFQIPLHDLYYSLSYIVQGISGKKTYVQAIRNAKTYDELFLACNKLEIIDK